MRKICSVFSLFAHKWEYSQNSKYFCPTDRRAQKILLLEVISAKLFLPFSDVLLDINKCRFFYYWLEARNGLNNLKSGDDCTQSPWDLSCENPFFQKLYCIKSYPEDVVKINVKKSSYEYIKYHMNILIY